MTVIYADAVFLINVAVDYLVILMTGRLAGISLRRKRFLLAALLGGVYGVAAIMPGAPFLMSAPAKVLVWLLLARTAYGASQQFLKLVLLLGIVSCALSGVILALGTLWGTSVHGNRFMPEFSLYLLICAACACLLCVPFFRTGVRSRISGMTLPVELSIAGTALKLTALLDTGNQLQDPLTGEPVLIVSAHALQSVSAPLKELVSSEALRSPTDLPLRIYRAAPELRPKLLPYQALGSPSGTLLALRADWVKIQGVTHRHTTVALAPVELGLGYSALWGGTWKGDRETHDDSETTPAMAAEPSELQRAGLLHRGE